MLALLEAGQFNLSIPLIDEAIKKAEEDGAWDSWIQFLILAIRCQGPVALGRVPAVREKLDERQIEFIDILTMILYCSDLNQGSCEYQKEFEDALATSAFPLLRTLACLAIRLRWNLSEGWKQAYSRYLKVLAADEHAAYPGSLNIDSSVLEEMALALMLLGQVRFQLSDTKLPALLEPLTSTQAKTILVAEVEALCAKAMFCDADLMLTSLQQLVTGTWSKSAVPDQLGFLCCTSADIQLKARLWAIQLQLQTDLDAGQRALCALKGEAGFIPSAYSHLLDAVISVKTGAPVHKTKESLLASLKLLNVTGGKDDVMKLSVMILLASIYQETDFGLAEKMASTAFQYSRNLGNHALALRAGRILAHMLELKGDEKAAGLQAQANIELEQLLARCV